MKTEKYQGFTLIELMIVVAILGVIAAIAIPAYHGYITTSHVTQCQNEVAAIKLAESEFFLENNRYFAGSGWQNLQTYSSGIYTASKAAQGAAGPSSPKECDYKVTTTSTSYTITATGTTTTGGNLTMYKSYVTVNGP